MADQSEAEETGLEGRLVWFLVQHSDDREAVEAVAEKLDASGIETDVVTITDVIGSAAREAVAGGAERILRGLRVAWQGAGGEEDFLAAIRREQPDLIVCTSPRYVRPLSLLESLTGVSSVQVGLPLDFNLGPDWMNGSIDTFVVSTDETAGRLEDAGWDPARVFVAGPPVRPRFSAKIDRAAERENLGLGDQKVVMVRADSFDPSTLDRFIFQATLVEGIPRFIFHHNGDGAAASALRRSADQHGLPAAMFGRVPDLERFFVASDVVVAVPGEPMLAEAVAAGSPLFLVGEERGWGDQIDTLTRNWGATYLPDVLRVGSELEAFLSDDRLQKARSMNDEGLLVPNNTDVAEALTDILGAFEHWETAGEPVGEPVSPEGGPSEGAPEGPFEPIGGGESSGEGDETGGGGRTRRLPGPGRPSLSRAEAKEQLAELILVERDLERRLDELDREQDRWRSRLDLAREWGEEDLAEEAEAILRDYLDEARDVQAELEDIRRQKDKLKQAARRGSEGQAATGGEPGGARGGESRRRSEEIEERFSEMEIDRDLDRLRDRIEGELGE